MQRIKDLFRRLFCKISIFVKNMVKLVTLTKITVVLILIAIIVGSCVQIVDRSTFHNYVIDQAKKETDYLVNNPTACVVDSSKIDKEGVRTDSACMVTSPFNNNSNSAANSYLHEDSVLDIISKSDGLLSSNGLTFCVSLVVGLLAALLLFRIEKMEQLVEKNRDLLDENRKLQSWTKKRYKVSNIITRIESAYNMSVLIDNMASLLHEQQNDPSNTNICIIIGGLSSRLNLLCREINESLNSQETRIEILKDDEKSIMYMYLEDTISALKRVTSKAEKLDILDLVSILKKDNENVQEIKKVIKRIEVET